MKINIGLIIPLLFILNPRLEAQQIDRWYGNNSAAVMERGKWESGILQPFRLGIGHKLEVTSNAFLMPLLPNAGIKAGWGNRRGFRVATEHSLGIPSVFLNAVSRKGTGGLLSPEFDFPLIVSLNNSLVLTRILADSSLLSFRLGINACLRGDKVDPLSTIDLPVFYPRMTSFYKGTGLRIMASYKNSFCKRWYYEQNLQLFLNVRNGLPGHMEYAGALMYKAGRSFRLKGGYNLSYGSYPFGNHWQLWPFVDIIFGSR